MLQAELRRSEPSLVPVLHRRASQWYAEHGMAGESIEHAIETDDAEYTDELVWRASIPDLGRGRSGTVGMWLDAFEYQALVQRPVLVVTAAWHALTIGDMARVRMWSAIASAFDGSHVLPDGSSMSAATALLRAMICAEGVVAMRDDAREAERLHHPGSPMMTMALMFAGHAERLLGNDSDARDLYEDGVALGARLNQAARVHCLAGLARLAIAADDWSGAARLIDDVVATIDEFGLESRPAMGGPTALAALVRAQQGDAVEARRLAKHGMFLVSMLTSVGPWMNVEARLELARAVLVLGDPAEARALVSEASTYLDLVADAPSLVAQVAELAAVLAEESVPLGLHETPLSPAELRVLRYKLEVSGIQALHLSRGRRPVLPKG